MSEDKRAAQEVNPPSYVNHLHKDRIRLKHEIVTRHLQSQSTPFMVLQLDEAVKSLSYFSKYLPFAKCFYAMKANSHPEILSLVKGQNWGLDVASSKEIEKAFAAGFKAENLILANPFKDERSLHQLFRSEISAFTYDGADELHKIDKFRRKHGYRHTPSSLLRINPVLQRFSRKSDPVDIQTDLSLKFGAPVAEARQLIGLAKDLKLKPEGIAYHIGSNCYRIKNFITNFKVAVETIVSMNQELGLDMKTIDMGGGFPNRASEALGVDNLEEFYSHLSNQLLESGAQKFNICAEPGRTIAGPTGILVTTIIGKRHFEGKTWLILDDGLYGCFSPVYHDHARYVFFPVRPDYLNANMKDQLLPYTLAGPTCDSFDTIAHDVFLPRNMDIGDQLFVMDNGAYTLDIRTNFNGFSGAEVVIEPLTAVTDSQKSAA